MLLSKLKTEFISYGTFSFQIHIMGAVQK